MPCVNCVERWRYDEVVKECEKLRNTNALFRAAYEEKRSQAQKYFEQATELQRDRNAAEARYEKAKELLRERDAELKDLYAKYENMSNKYAKAFKENGVSLRTANARNIEIREENIKLRKENKELRSKYAKQRALNTELLIETSSVHSALHIRNALLQILFLATGIQEEMLPEMFHCCFFTPDASFDAELVAHTIQHCIETNSTIIDTITGFRFDIAERLRQAVQVRNWDGTPKPTLVVKPAPEPDAAQPVSQPAVKPTAKRCKAEGKEEGAPRPTNARCRNKRKKKDVRAKPEQSE